MRIQLFGISFFLFALLGKYLVSGAPGGEATDHAGLVDTALEEEVRKSVGVFSRELTVGDLKQTTRLIASNPSIANLSGLEHAEPPRLSLSES